MKHEYRVHWHQCPHNRFDPHVTKYTRPTGGYVISGAPQDGEL
jgi:hypothetical protein